MTRRALFTLLPVACLQAASPRVRGFSLADTTGQQHTLSDLKSTGLGVLIFAATDCPITNSYIPRLHELQADYAGRVTFLAVHSDPAEKPEKVRTYADEYQYRMPVLLDRKQTLARQTGATVMPEVVLLTASGRILYRGRIDDRYAAWGKKRATATEHNLRDAIEAALRGDRSFHPGPKAIGCYIPFLDSKS